VLWSQSGSEYPQYRLQRHPLSTQPNKMVHSNCWASLGRPFTVKRPFEAQSHESHRLAPSPSLNPTELLTQQVHVLGLCRHSEPEYLNCHLQCHSLSHPPQLSNAAHFSCWPTLGSRTNSQLRMSEAQPYQNKARLAHRGYRRTTPNWRNRAITGSWNLCTVIHGVILCHAMCNRARRHIEASCRYWYRQSIHGV